MYAWMKWVFDGIGTEILVAVISLVIGGIGGFTVGKHSKSKQIQKAENKAKQKQYFSVTGTNLSGKEKHNESSLIVQKQEAGNNAEQVQTGSVKHGRK